MAEALGWRYGLIPMWAIASLTIAVCLRRKPDSRPLKIGAATFVAFGVALTWWLGGGGYV
jgi:hypothetical protein